MLGSFPKHIEAGIFCVDYHRAQPPEPALACWRRTWATTTSETESSDTIARLGSVGNAAGLSPAANEYEAEERSAPGSHFQ